MAFPKALLADHEKLVFDLKPHWIALVPSVLWSLLFLVASILLAKYVYDTDGKYVWWEIALTVAVLLGWYVLAVLPFLRWYFTSFVLTSDRLITRQGVIAKHSKEIPLERINDVAFSQSILERFLGAGDLLLESAGERGQNKITNVRKPEQVQLMIYKETEMNNARMMQPGGGMKPTEASVAKQLEELKALNDQGIVSDEEYENKRQELLKRL